MNKPNILFWDIETAPIVATTWTLYPKAISHKNIQQDWYIICGAWKWAGKPAVQAAKIDKPLKDKELCKKLRDVIAKADIIVHHNGNRFDLKKLNARLIFHGLAPLPMIPTVDTLKEVKKVAAFTSNRLDYLAKILTGTGKLDAPYELWLDIMKGSKAALATTVAYCKEDVNCLERVYNYLLPYMNSHPHVGVISGQVRDESCPKCGSKNLKFNGVRVSAAGIKKQEVQCGNCHSYSRIKFK
ncbi:MAG: ribonuclease H-like domain-containing protein [Planctomycetota bacterium]|nr:ribonuclease H-like domain-containing protein [Planctomycetota bacterium]MDE2217244.1 ribonuclease H-like domain-containing protein [Planctomycetota bacterium]